MRSLCSFLVIISIVVSCRSIERKNDDNESASQAIAEDPVVMPASGSYPENGKIAKDYWSNYSKSGSKKLTAFESSATQATEKIMLRLPGSPVSMIDSELEDILTQIRHVTTDHETFVTVDNTGAFIMVVYLNPTLGYYIPKNKSLAICEGYRPGDGRVPASILDCFNIGSIYDVITNQRYPNNSAIRSGSTIYHDNGATLVSSSSSSSYYETNQLMLSGSTYTWPNNININNNGVRYPDNASAFSGGTLYFRNNTTYASGSTVNYFGLNQYAKSGNTYYTPENVTVSTSNTDKYSFRKIFSSDIVTINAESTRSANILAIVQKPAGTTNYSNEHVVRRVSGVDLKNPDPVPNAPANLTLTSPRFDTINVSWNAPASTPVAISNYRVSLSTSTSGLDCTSGSSIPSTSTSTSISGLQEGLTYYVRLCSESNDQLLSSAVDSNIRTLIEAPRNPINLVFKASATSILASWTSGYGNTRSYVVSTVGGPTPPASCSSGVDIGNTESRRLDSLQQNQEFSFRVCAKNSQGTLSSGTTGTSKTYFASSGVGIPGVYFNNTNFTGSPSINRTDARIAFNWGRSSPGGGINTTNWSARWEGAIEPYSNENYTIYLRHDDGVRLWFNDVLVIDKWFTTAAIESIYSVAMQKNNRYKVKIEYFQSTGDASLEFGWSAPSVIKEAIPATQLHSSVVFVASKCEIEQSVCTNHPDRTGRFEDDWDGSKTNKDRCLRRAFEFANWCGNPPSVQTTAYFTDTAGVISQISSSNSGCRITQNTCNEFPSVVGTFADTHDGSSTNEARCLRRAGDYSEWCSNPKGVLTTAQYIRTDGTIASSSLTSTGCFIVQNVCTNYPAYVGVLADDWDGSSTNETRCLNRAADYGNWCNNPRGTVTRAKFVRSNNTTATRSFTK